MPVYEFACPDCPARFDQRRPVEARHTAPCPRCGGVAARQFRPNAVMIQTPASLHYIQADFQPLSTPAHSSSYLQGRLIDQTEQQIHERFAARKPVPTLQERVLEKYPDTRFDQPFTPADQAEFQTLLAQGPPKEKA